PRKGEVFIIKVALKTLGCKINQYETESIIDFFKDKGFQIVDFHQNADIYIINTCTVTQEADRKSKQMIRKAIRQNRKAKIIVTGCYAQSNYEDLQKIEGISLIAGNGEKNDILQQLEKIDFHDTVIRVKPAKYLKKYDNILKNKSSSLHTRAWLKIQDGCNRFCTYCKVPYVRGPARSRSVEDVMEEVSNLSSNGVKEVVLAGINLGTYGRDIDKGKTNLAKLISLISNFKGIKRIRLSSIELINIDAELLNIFKNCSKFCHHLHIPLQSGDNKILNLMNRPYDTSIFYQKISLIKETIPDIAITTDIMVGFPNEDSNSFSKTVNFARKICFAKIHVFQYSDRKECLSSLLPNKVDKGTKKERSKKLQELSKELFYDFQKRFLNSITEILVEDEIKDQEGRIYSRGITSNYIKIIIPDFIAKKGEIVSVKLHQICSKYIVSKILLK
ncbi:MAG: tRNA (N(6)-L-threonylcarbamoyladenosine(37)-C(2))-methylthiotransferase MtaB, partial [Candidatus Atribacteria bacterium]|nr:tRNA (N(6)-L-threonylcarbamoyladenosine(37)-C(2))-methylthiotransferase MtaB [Candidatus Atribacteria bacterium]